MKVIAECGVNWKNIEEAMVMILKAEKVGCWAAKFQIFNEKVAPGLSKHLYLHREIVADLFEFGKNAGIEVFFTCMFPEAVDWCEDVGVNYYKIRYKDNENRGLISRVLMTDKPFFISADEVLNIGIESRNMNPLFCRPIYPAHDVDYIAPFSFYEYFKGVSDHTPGTTLLKKGLEKDIKYWEKHVKLDNNCIESAWSITFEELEEVLKE